MYSPSQQPEHYSSDVLRVKCRVRLFHSPRDRVGWKAPRGIPRAKPGTPGVLEKAGVKGVNECPAAGAAIA